MNKRGQIYLMAAIIFCMLAFLVVSQPNFIRERILLQNFKSLSNNYLTESPKVVNNALDKEVNVATKLGKFTDDFVKNYAKNQDPNIGLIYIYNDKNGVVIQNFLNGEKAYFLKSGGEDIQVSFPATEQVGGDMIFVGTGTTIAESTNLCNFKEGSTNFCPVEVGESNLNCCTIQSGVLGSGDYVLKIGDIDYKFKISEDSPKLIVIVKSKDKDVVKVDVSENKL